MSHGIKCGDLRRECLQQQQGWTCCNIGQMKTVHHFHSNLCCIRSKVPHELDFPILLSQEQQHHDRQDVGHQD
jgi:hypothetical protein